MTKTHCEICDRSFKNEEALEMHNSSKHASPAKKEKKPLKLGKPIGFVVVATIIILFAWLIFGVATAGNQYADLAQCITDSGAKMYGAFWCSACSEQKAILGQSFKKIDYVECSLPDKSDQTQICKDENIQSYPTWEFADGTKQSGVLTPQQLSQKTGCPLP